MHTDQQTNTCLKAPWVAEALSSYALTWALLRLLVLLRGDARGRVRQGRSAFQNFSYEKFARLAETGLAQNDLNYPNITY